MDGRRNRARCQDRNGKSQVCSDQVAIFGNADCGDLGLLPARLAEHGPTFRIVWIDDPHIEGVEGGGVSAKTDAQYAQYHDVDLGAVHPAVWAKARKYRRIGYAARKARQSNVIVSVAECVRHLGVGRHRIRRLIEDHVVWSDRRPCRNTLGRTYRTGIVVNLDEVRKALATEDVLSKVPKAIVPERKSVPQGWIAITDLAIEVAVTASTMSQWCRKKWIPGQKFCVPRTNKAGSREWHVEREATIAFLRAKVSGKGNHLKRNPVSATSPLIEDIWRKPDIEPEVREFWEQENG